MRFSVNWTQGEKRFPYFELPDGRGRQRVYVHKLFVKTEDDSDYVEFPLFNSELHKTEKGTWVIRRGNKTTFYYHIPCGYRGEGYVKEWLTERPSLILSTNTYRSPAGSLGIGTAIIFSIDKSTKLVWQRTGRLYGADPEGVVEFTPDGEINDLPVETIDEELEELL